MNCQKLWSPPGREYWLVWGESMPSPTPGTSYYLPELTLTDGPGSFMVHALSPAMVSVMKNDPGSFMKRIRMRDLGRVDL